MINNLGTPSSEMQINFDVLQIDTENSAIGLVEKKNWLKKMKSTICKQMWNTRKDIYVTSSAEVFKL